MSVILFFYFLIYLFCFNYSTLNYNFCFFCSSFSFPSCIVNLMSFFKLFGFVSPKFLLTLTLYNIFFLTFLIPPCDPVENFYQFNFCFMSQINSILIKKFFLLSPIIYQFFYKNKIKSQLFWDYDS